MQIDINERHLYKTSRGIQQWFKPRLLETKESSLYGLKQAGRQWNDELNNSLLDMNFRRLVSDPCIYIKEKRNKGNNMHHHCIR
jgi:hypothetical protein